MDFRQTGPGRWESVVDSSDAGTYVAAIRYAVPDADGTMTEGSTQASITRPFADEFRALQDNAPLLTQVAEMTGGRVLTDLRPEALDLWQRADLGFPVSTKPIWLIVTVLSIAVFLFDVAVRRVRIDFFAVVRGARKAAARSQQAATTQIDALQAARAKAQTRTGRTADADVSRPMRTAAAPPPADVAKRKFEATEDQARRPTGSVALKGEASEESEIVRKRREEAERRRSEQIKAEGGDEDSMSRLLKAKKRAQEDRES